MLSALLLGAVVSAAGAQSATAPDAPGIVRARCVSCHRPGGDAPFSLASIDDMRRRASMIAAVTTSRYMPPWKPAPGFGEFQHSRRLTDKEISAIESWVAAGAPGDGTADPPATTGDTSSWPLGEPDLIVRLPAYSLRPDGPDVFRNFVVSAAADRGRIVRGMQFRPMSRAVHHANIRVDATPASRQLDEADAAPGYEGVIARSADFPDGQFLGWTPGQLAPVLSHATAWRLPARSDLVVQLHLRPTGAEETIAPVIGFYFGDRAPANTPVMLRLGRQDLDIPAGVSSHAVTDSFVLPVTIEALAIQAHAHYRARSVVASATLPDGSRQPLLRIGDWDVNWQDRYAYQRPVRLPAGTRLTTTYVFDNSASNPRNPNRPPARTRWGWRSSDEMADVWIQAVTAAEADRATLHAAITTKMLREDAAGVEVLLEREPNHVALRNDAAQIYLALGRPERALAHFERVRALQRSSAAAWFNEGTALEAMGRTSDAKSRYRKALVLDSQYSPALNNLGALDLRDGLLAQARTAFELAVRSDPANADAHANLGLVLIATSNPELGVTSIERALAMKPQLLAGMMPHAWLLAANVDPRMRRAAAALDLAQRIAEVSTDRAGALDLLAACLAATGDFDRAVQTAGAALAAAPASSSHSTAIRERIALYRNRRPFALGK